MSTSFTDGGVLRARRSFAVLLAVIGLFIGVIAVPAAEAAVDPLPNPAFPQECGITVAIVMDTSNSIVRDDAANPQLMKDASKVVVDALTGTPSTVGVFSFRTLSTTEIGYTDISDAGNAASVNAAIDATDFSIAGTTAPNPGGTNWEAGFLEAGTSPDVVI
ncbi:MAG: VWA domain-containing protein, partial [Acidimicrobiia bacterium]|nr:VWA domain-containing protein [Acidimicrobiia bacterium]